MSQRRSQKTLNKSSREDLNETQSQSLDESVKRCVRYFLVASEGNLPIKKADIRKSVPLNTAGTFDLVMKRTAKELKRIFGYKVIELEDDNALYVLIKNTGYDVEDGDNKNPKKILILLVLTHVFMSGGATSEASMSSFLNSLKIDLNGNDEFFGNVKEFVYVTLEKQKYLSIEVDELTKAKCFKWGSRAEATVSKNAILKFVCETYGSKKNLQPEQFKEQYEQSQEQNLLTSSTSNNNQN